MIPQGAAGGVVEARIDIESGLISISIRFDVDADQGVKSLGESPWRCAQVLTNAERMSQLIYGRRRAAREGGKGGKCSW
jgi:hypothetical protein